MANLFGKFSWIYIDEDDSYKQVKKDIEDASPLIEEGGYLVFDGYTLWNPANMMNYGVSRAVNATSNWEIAYFALQGGGTTRLC